jgi:ribonuclease J
VLFPEPELLGVDLVIPDLRFLQQFQGRVAALVLTHGHEDHIGAVPYVAPLVDGPIFGTPFTLALVQPKLEQHGIDINGRLRTIKPREVVEVGPFRIEFLRVTHSMPDCVALAIHTPIGTVIHTGDFKIDQTPLDGECFDFHRFAELGGAGVLALFADSTNIDRHGFTGSEVEVIGAFEEILTGADGKVIVAAFASSIYRMQILVDLASQFGRNVAFVGRGVVENAATAERLGLLRIPASLQIRDVDVRNYPSQDVLCICTGSQGEPQAALPRIAIDDHRHVNLQKGDVVVFSARAIPGNEKGIGRVMNHIARRGADVIYEGLKHVHVSGHGSEEELKLMPHSCGRNLRAVLAMPPARHARIARDVSERTEVLLAENGDYLRFTAGGARSPSHSCGRVLIDSTGTGEVGRIWGSPALAADGLLVPVLAIGRSGMLERSRTDRGVRRDPHARTLRSAGPLRKPWMATVEETPTRAHKEKGARDPAVHPETRRAAPLVLPVIGIEVGPVSRVTSVERDRRGRAFACALVWLVALASYTPSTRCGSSTPGRTCLREPRGARRGIPGRTRLPDVNCSSPVPAVLAAVGWHYVVPCLRRAVQGVRWRAPPGVLVVHGPAFGSLDVSGRPFRRVGHRRMARGGMAEYLNRTGSIILILGCCSWRLFSRRSSFRPRVPGAAGAAGRSP